ncbi:hypothetical protein ACIQ4I_05640 [Rummeliibacillus sp. NPDC094406]|uniref:hypothetical protein n=1 Tax=Rummeliibacillus sp. NPDC094406 TaxID=3364511 RepID=UPI0037F7AF47
MKTHHLTDEQLAFLKHERNVLKEKFRGACNEFGFNSAQARYYDGKTDGLIETVLYLGVSLEEINGK